MGWAVAKAFVIEKEYASMSMSGETDVVGPNGESFFAVMAKEVLRRGWSELKSQEAATILWSLAVSGEEFGDTFEAARIDLEGRDKARLNPVDMANIAWAFAHAKGSRASTLFEQLEEELLREPEGGGGSARLAEFSSLTMSNMAVSFARWARSEECHFPLL